MEITGSSNHSMSTSFLQSNLFSRKYSGFRKVRAKNSDVGSQDLFKEIVGIFWNISTVYRKSWLLHWGEKTETRHSTEIWCLLTCGIPGLCFCSHILFWEMRGKSHLGFLGTMTRNSNLYYSAVVIWDHCTWNKSTW